MDDDLFLNRDLSWLSFNYRVLMEAKDQEVPLLERLRFTAIYSSNLDEFFRVRVAATRHLAEIGKKKINKAFGAVPDELLNEIHDGVEEQLKEYGAILDEVLKELGQKGIQIVTDHQDIPEEIRTDLEWYFKTKVLAYLKPHLFGISKNDAFLRNRGLYLAVRLKKDDNEISGYVNIPSDELPRFYLFKKEEGFGYCFLDDILRLNLDQIFQGYEILECRSVKLNKDADLHIDDEFEGNLVKKVEKQVKKRDLGKPSRFLYDGSMSKKLLKVFVEEFELEGPDKVKGGRYHNLNDYFQIGNPLKDPSLEYEKAPPSRNKLIDSEQSILKAIEKQDQILHFPYQSYDYILEFFNEAAIDPEVKEINATFYRMAKSSVIANALISAALNGKKVRVFMEVKARFDEENNLYWAEKMKAAGVKIKYSMPGLKVHAKVGLVKKKTDDGKKIWYGFFGTGNLNESTAKIYCDHGLLSTDKKMTRELSKVFSFLRSKKKSKKGFEELIVSQFDADAAFASLIDREIANAKSGAKAAMIIKVNNLEEPHLIKKIYEAAEAGVEVQLIVRSICCLKPGVAGLKVVRIVDRFLEHARVFYFYNAGLEEVYMGSSDWMKRNIYRRVEVTFPVKDPEIKKQIMDILNMQLSDNIKACYFNSDFSNERIHNSEADVRAQEATYHYVKSLNEW